MKSCRPPGNLPRVRGSTLRRGFTLVEVLAALLLMAIVVPVTMEGLSVASRVGLLGQRKAAAMRVAERLLNELLVEGQTQQASASGTAADGETVYPWASHVENWPEDALQQLSVTVTFTVQGHDYDVTVTTLLPASPTTDATGALATSSR